MVSTLYLDATRIQCLILYDEVFVKEIGYQPQRVIRNTDFPHSQITTNI